MKENEGGVMRRNIDSASNKKIKLALSLKQRKYREREGLFLAEGVRLCEMAADSDWTVSFGLYTEALLGDGRGRDLLERLEGAGCDLYEVPGSVFGRVSATENPQGILLVMEKKETGMEELASGHALLMVLDGVQDPGNAGTMIRTADAAGASGVLFLEGTVDAFSDKTVRATMGSLFHLPICSGVARRDFLDFCRSREIALYGAALDAAGKAYHEADLSGRTALVFGNEAKGASREILDASGKIYIPMYGGAESLNVATAAAVILYEAARQRSYRAGG